MKKSPLFLIFLSSILTFSAYTADIKTFKYTFSENEPFTVAFADYPQGQEEFFELTSKQNAILPNEIQTKHTGLKISGNNHSDDLFMYAYQKISGLKPNTIYHVSFSLEFASNAPQGTIGAGGSEDAVYVKIGAVAKEPGRTIDGVNHYRIDVDKGNQELDGKDMILIGTIGVDTQDSIYRLSTLPYMPNEEMQNKLNNYRVTTNDKGEAWVVFGTDSGYESTTTLFYTNLSVTFKELEH